MTRTKILIGRGITSPVDSIAYLDATAISERLGMYPVDFPGNHAGMNAESEQFAIRVSELLLRG